MTWRKGSIPGAGAGATLKEMGSVESVVSALAGLRKTFDAASLVAKSWAAMQFSRVPPSCRNQADCGE